MKDLDELMTMLNGFTATALGANISSDIHRAAQDNARMIFQEILRDAQKQHQFPNDEGIKMAVKIGVILARKVAEECAPLFSPSLVEKRARESPTADMPTSGALTQEEIDAFLRGEKP